MQGIAIILAGAVWILFTGSVSLAQPVLNRVEQSLRDQLGSPPAPAAEAPTGKPEPGYLGVIADDRQEDGKGVRILNVIPSGPAAAGGLQTNDLITGIDGQPIKAMADMGRALEHQLSGTRLIFTVTR